MTSVLLNPKELADALHNAFVCSKEKVAHMTVNHVLVSIGPRRLEVYGMGHYLGGRTTVPLQSEGPAERIECAILRDEANTLQSRLRKVLGGKSAIVSLDIDDDPVQVGEVWANFRVSEGKDTLTALPDSDPDGDYNPHFTWLEARLNDGPKPVAQPVAFATETITRLKDLKSDGAKTDNPGVIDMCQSSVEGALIVAVGTTFRGLIAKVDRDGYKSGGPWGDGVGTQEHLFG